MAHRPYLGDGSIGKALCQGRGGRRAAASERPLRSHILMGGVFGLTTNATSTPAQFGRCGDSSAPTELAHGLDKPLSCIQNPLLRRQRGHTILRNQWIEHQPAIDTAEYRSFLRKLRSPLFHHQPFAFLTGHRACPPAFMCSSADKSAFHKGDFNIARLIRC